MSADSSQDPDPPVSKAQKKRARRSAARLSAVQALYQMDIAKTDLNRVIHEFTQIRTGVEAAKVRVAEQREMAAKADRSAERRDEVSEAAPDRGEPIVATPDEDDTENTVIATADQTYFAEILRGVVRLQRTIDPEVDKQLAKGWRLARIDSILRQTLRAAAFELIERTEVPARAILSEYIDIAKAFFDGDEPKVVNGVLDQLARQFRPDEFARTMAASSDGPASDAVATGQATVPDEPDENAAISPALDATAKPD